MEKPKSIYIYPTLFLMQITKLLREKEKNNIFCKTEPEIQPIILDKIEDKLRLYGFDIWREVRKNEGPVDFLIHYGFSPSFKCIIEVKLSYHSDFCRKKSEKIINGKSFKQLRDKYLTGLEADNGVLF